MGAAGLGETGEEELEVIIEQTPQLVEYYLDLRGCQRAAADTANHGIGTADRVTGVTIQMGVMGFQMSLSAAINQGDGLASILSGKKALYLEAGPGNWPKYPKGRHSGIARSPSPGYWHGDTNAPGQLDRVSTVEKETSMRSAEAKSSGSTGFQRIFENSFCHYPFIVDTRSISQILTKVVMMKYWIIDSQSGQIHN
jgi:hypothetical protein